jgi:redox-sensitive bicupin YhaK (pirin superfamily)
MADAGRSFTYDLRSSGHGAFVFVREGSANVDGMALGRRDGAGFWERDNLAIEIEITEDDTDIMIVETIMIDDANIKVWEHDHAGH